VFQNHQNIFHSFHSFCFRTIKRSFTAFVSEPSRDLSQLCFRTIKKSSTVSVSETSRDLSQFSFQNHQEIFTACVSKPSRRSFTRLTTSRGLTQQYIWNSDLCYKDYPSCSCCAKVARSIAATFGNCSSTMCGFVEHFKSLLEGL
jgi:hypothetical protein